MDYLFSLMHYLYYKDEYQVQQLFNVYKVYSTSHRIINFEFVTNFKNYQINKVNNISFCLCNYIEYEIINLIFKS